MNVPRSFFDLDSHLQNFRHDIIRFAQIPKLYRSIDPVVLMYNRQDT